VNIDTINYVIPLALHATAGFHLKPILANAPDLSTLFLLFYGALACLTGFIGAESELLFQKKLLRLPSDQKTSKHYNLAFVLFKNATL